MIVPGRVPTIPACTWWNRPEEDNSSGKLESTHPSRTSVKSDQGFFGVESVMRVNADSLLIRAAATSTSGTLNDLTTDLIMANNNIVPGMFVCSSFLISVCMFIVSKALLISSVTVIVRAGGAIWLNPFATVLFSVCSAVTVECCVLYPCCMGVFGMFAVM